MSATATIGAAAAKKALGKVLDDIYDLAKLEIKKRIRRWRTKRKIDTLYTKLRNVRLVKTIWQAERAVDLLKFYHPSRLKIDGERPIINDLSDVPYEGNVVIQGTVGLGKSIFFRYLTSREMVKGEALPVFVELRRVKEGQRLVERVVEEVKSLGVDIDEQIFVFLADEGKIVLLLDGFDEVREGDRARLIDEMECLAKRHERLRMLISSRPNGGIENSAFFRVFDLSPLKGDEYKDLIAKLADDPKTLSAIIKQITASKGKIEQLLTTPLMVALLMVRFRVDGSIPENIVAFYDDLFPLLLRRHDRLKPGYVRPRKSGLSDRALEEIFNALSFLTRKKGEGTFTLKQLSGYAKDAIAIVGEDADPEKFLADIIEITSLVVEEGGECEFIHKSVQEYHAACFIKEQPEDTGKRFYQAVVTDWSSWDQELVFLESIDRYRFLKWFLIPEMRRVLALEGRRLPERFEPTAEDAVRLFGDDLLGFPGGDHLSLRPSSLGSLSWSLTRASDHPFSPPYVPAIFPNVSTIHGLLDRGELPTADHYERPKPPFFLAVRLKDLIRCTQFSEPIVRAVGAALGSMFENLIAAQKFVAHVDARESVFEF